MLYDDHLNEIRQQHERNEQSTVKRKKAPHDIFAAGLILGFAKEAEVAMKTAASAFLE